MYVTDAEEEPPYLNPWIQWVTVHSGMPYGEHKIFEQGEGHSLEKQCLWEGVNSAGLKSWVCGAMNVRFHKPFRGRVLPDPWTVGTMLYPESVALYFKFVQRHVRECTNDRVPLTRADYFRFLTFMLTHGLSATSIFAIVKQLLSERLADSSWRRASTLDRLQFDLFRWYHRGGKPEFSLYFLISTAHLQHKY